MEYLGLPLRVDDRGWLVRGSPSDLVLAFIQTAALTYRNTWPPDPDFGLRDEFEKKDVNEGLPQKAVNMLNGSLDRFGWKDFRVLSIRKIPAAEETARSSYVVSLATPDRGNLALELNLTSAFAGR